MSCNFFSVQKLVRDLITQASLNSFQINDNIRITLQLKEASDSLGQTAIYCTAQHFHKPSFYSEFIPFLTIAELVFQFKLMLKYLWFLDKWHRSAWE